MKLEVDQLLTIDVDSEIRKLAEAELGGTWQIPAELVRRALRAGATTVQVKVSPTRFEVRDDGPPIDAETVRSLTQLLEPSNPPALRHRALLELEAEAEVGLVSLAGLAAKSLRLAQYGAEVLCRGAATGEVPRHGVAIEVDGVLLDAPQARKWLAMAVRFAPATVILEGVEAPRGATDAIVEQPLEPPLDGSVALLRTSESSRVWLLRWGVVVTHTTLPSGLGVEAAVELGDRAKGQIGAGELRHAFKGELEEVEAQAIDVAIATAADMGQLLPADRQKVRLLLLGSSKLARSPEVRKVKMLPALHGPARELEWMSIDQLTRHASSHTVLAVETEAKAENAVTHQPIFVLAPSERARLSQLFGLSFSPPPAAPTAGPLLSLRGSVDTVRRVARAAAGAMAGSWQQTLPPELLTETERKALEVFTKAIAHSGKKAAFVAVELCRGDGPAHLRGRPKRLMLPRGNREVRAAVKVVVKDPSWAYPALIALLGGDAMPPSGARDGWVRR